MNNLKTLIAAAIAALCLVPATHARAAQPTLSYETVPLTPKGQHDSWFRSVCGNRILLFVRGAAGMKSAVFNTDDFSSTLLDDLFREPSGLTKDGGYLAYKRNPKYSGEVALTVKDKKEVPLDDGNTAGEPHFTMGPRVLGNRTAHAENGTWQEDGRQACAWEGGSSFALPTEMGYDCSTVAACDESIAVGSETQGHTPYVSLPVTWRKTDGKWSCNHLPLLANTTQGEATAVGNGVIAGTCSVKQIYDASDYHPVVWSYGEAIALTKDEGEALAISRDGTRIAGWSRKATDKAWVKRATLWTRAENGTYQQSDLSDKAGSDIVLDKVVAITDGGDFVCSRETYDQVYLLCPTMIVK